MVFTIALWFIVVMLNLNVLSTIALIGKPRVPITHGVALWVVLINVPLVVVIGHHLLTT